MTLVPLPDTPCCRVRCIWNEGGIGEGGVRFYVAYSGSAPSSANCATLASDISDAWSSHLASLMSNYWSLNEVDVLDIASDSGASGNWTGTVEGSRSGDVLPDQVATNVEFGIARRYRGGKPRMFLPPGNVADTDTASKWTSDFVSAVQTGVEDFFAAFLADSIGSMGTLKHINLSYYKGFTNITNSSGRERAVPTYRATALHDDVESYDPKFVLGSQRRRRTSTTP